MKVLHVSMFFATESLENEQRKHKMKWRERRNTQTAKNERVIGRKIWI